MNTKLIAIATSALAMTIAAESAMAQTPWVDNREHRQGERIYEGVQDGDLTLRETGQLIRGQARVRRMEHRFKSDGVVTPFERLRLHDQLNKQSVRIYNKKHN